MTNEQYVYLHGFASSPRSHKAQYLQAQLATAGQHLTVPDLNTGGFFDLTMTRQLDQVSQIVSQQDTPTVLIGSSFGGLTAAWVAERCPRVTRLILLAPAFDFLIHLRSALGAKYAHWQWSGKLSLYHYGSEQEETLSYTFIEDLTRYPDVSLTRSLPTLIIHGNKDTIIPISASQHYQKTRPWVKLDTVIDDHSLVQSLPRIWHHIYTSMESKRC